MRRLALWGDIEADKTGTTINEPAPPAVPAHLSLVPS